MDALNAVVQQVPHLRVGVYGVQEGEADLRMLGVGVDHHDAALGGLCGDDTVGDLLGHNGIAEIRGVAGGGIGAAGRQAQEHVLSLEPGEGGAQAGVLVDVTGLIVPVQELQGFLCIGGFKDVDHLAAAVVGIDHERDGVIGHIFVVAQGPDIEAAGVKKQRDTARLLLGNLRQKGLQRGKAVVL